MIFERKTLIFAFNAILCLEILATTDDCYKDSSSYTGNLSVTVKGRMCIAWSEIDLCNDCNFPDGNVAAAANYCRDPDQSGWLWCFTEHDLDWVIFEKCQLQSCKVTVCSGRSCANGGRQVRSWNECICNCSDEFGGDRCEIVMVRSEWPDGPYALPMLRNRCPEGQEKGWTTGHIDITTNEIKSTSERYNSVIDDLKLNYTFVTVNGSSFRLKFCSKVANIGNSVNNKAIAWPEGDFGVFGINESCPQGFVYKGLRLSLHKNVTVDMEGVVPAVFNQNANELIIQICTKAAKELEDDTPHLKSNIPFSLLNNGHCLIDAAFTVREVGVLLPGISSGTSNEIKFCIFESRGLVKLAEVRLSNGNISSEGFVQIQYGGHWWSICDGQPHKWGDNETNVACKVAGYSYGIADIEKYPINASEQDFTVSLSCNGRENELSDCNIYWHDWSTKRNCSLRAVARCFRGCFGITCKNGGILEAEEPKCSCICPHGYFGLFCEIKQGVSNWPPGPFALPMLNNTCPENWGRGWWKSYVHFVWKERWLLTQQIKPNTVFGQFSEISFRLTFCIKSGNSVFTNSSADVKWPEGSYGIYGLNKSCPDGFISREETIGLPAVVTVNTDGLVPVEFLNHSNTLIIYTCWKDRNQNISVEGLPWKPPFIILKDTDKSCMNQESSTVSPEIVALPSRNGRDIIYHPMEFCSYATSASAEEETAAQVDRCDQNLGLTDGYISAIQLTSSSEDSMYSLSRIGLHSKGWCAMSGDPNPFVQVDLLFATVVEGLRVQNSFVFPSREETLGPIVYNAGAKDLVISYGNDVEKLLTYIEENEFVPKEKKIISLDYNDYEKTISFVRPFIARYVKIDLVGVWNRPCLRLEITGCRIPVSYKCNPGSVRRGWVSDVEGFLPASKLDIPSINSSEACAAEADSMNAVAFKYSNETSQCIIAVDNMTTFSWIDKEDYMVQPCYDVVKISQDYVREMDGPGIIASEGYPFYYIQNTSMQWMVQMENSVYPDVYFIYISLEDSSEVSIYFNPEKRYDSGADYTLTSQMNGSQVRQLSTSNQLFISFSTKSYSNVEIRKGRGFFAMVTQSRHRRCLDSCDKFDNDTPVLIISNYLLVSPAVPTALPEVISFNTDRCNCIIYLNLVHLNAVCNVSQLIVERSKYALDHRESWCNLNRPHTNESRRILPDANLKITFIHLPVRDDGNRQQGFELKYVSRQHADLCVTLNSDYDNKFCFIMEFNRRKITWSEANETCRRKHDGRLATLHTEEEFRIAQQLVYHSTTYFSFDSFFRVAYIGFRRNPNRQRKGDPREFTWLDGRPLTYSAWGGGFPNMFPMSDCALLNGENFDANAHIENALCSARVTGMFICELNSSNTDAVREKLDQPVLPSHERNANISHVWTCKSGEFIVLLYRCDGIPNCLDESDEKDCIYTARDNDKCPDDAFQCSDRNCISISQFCDHIQNCKDGSDEACEYRLCRTDEIRCNNGQCILKEDWCNAKQNCFDGSDEKFCIKCSGEGKTTFRCADLTCINMERVCDGFYDCPNMDDEKKCTIEAKSCHDWWKNGKRVTGVYAVSFETTSHVNVECNFDRVNESVLLTTVYNVDYTMKSKVSNGSALIELIYAPMETDYIRYNVNKGRNCTQSIRFGCTEPRQKIADIIGESLYPECRCESTLYTNISSDGEKRWNETRKTCANFTFKLHYYKVTEIFFIFLNLSTLTYNLRGITVGPLVCQETFYPDDGMMPCDKGHPVSNKTRCLYDEELYGSPVGCADMSHTKHCDTFICPENFVKCPGSYCLAVRFVCDGFKQCPNGEDEVDCGSRGRDCPGYCRCNQTNICLPPSQVCDGIVHCPSGDDERFCNMNCPGTCTCQGTFVDCRDGRITATEIALLSPESRKLFFSNSMIGNITIPFILPMALLINLSDSGIQEIQPGKFESMKNLRTLDISCNKLIVLYANTFKGLKRLRELILYNNRYLKKIERGAFRELENIEEINITHLLISYLQSATFEGLQNVKRIDLRFNKIHQVENRAFYGLDKLETLLISNNEIKVFESEIFSGMTSLHYLETDNLELCCMRPNSVDEANCLSQKDEFASCENLVRNVSLRVLLWIIGSLSLVGNLVSFIYRKWKEGIKLKKGYGMFVTNLIVADLLMGIYLLIIAVADAHFRNSFVRKDEWCRSGAYCAVAAVLSTLSSEASIFFVMLITLDRILVVKFPFGQVRLTPRVCIAVSYLAWLIAIVLSLLPLGLNMYFQGQFYSRTTVCLTFPLTKDKPPGWEYSFAILITLNVLLSFLIAFGQLLIFKATRARSAMLKRQKSSPDQALVVARNLFLVVFANCLCWLPIGVVGILALMKYTIPGDVYAWVFLVILPIGSVMNPIIYTLSAAIKGEKFVPALCEQDFVSKEDIARVVEMFGFDVFLTTDAPNLTRASTCIENRTLNLKQIQYLTTKIGERFDFLHKRMLYYGNLTTDNIWIFLADEEIKGIWLQGKPKRAVNKQVQSADIRFLGSVLGALMEPHGRVEHEIEGPE